MSNKNVTKIERLSSGMVKLYNKSNVIGAFSALNSISIGYENNNARTIQFTDNGNTISFQLFNLQEIIGSTTSVTYTPIDTTSTGPDYNARVFEVFDFLSSEVFQGFSPGPTYVGGVVAAYPNFASFPVTGTQSVIYIDEADNSAYYWDGTSYQLLVSTGVEQYASFALFPVTGSANVIYIDMSTFEPYVWDGAAYVSLTDSATVAWGNITGVLSDQTDLQAALDDKVPYTGATGNVDLGEYELKAGQVELDQTPTGTAGVAVMRWNDTDGTADLGLKGGNVTLQLGQEMLIRAVNKSGGDLLEANYQAVRLRLVSEGGAAGQRLAVKLALADSDINSATTIGLVTETILNNQEGFITTIGNVREINTTGSLQGETWVDGDILYLSPTVAGQLTNVKPVAPDHLVVVGYVEYAHAIHGKIYVKCDNGYELDELHNVYINAPTTWQVLRYDATAGYWTNSSLTASILPGGIDASKIGAGTVDNTEFGYLDGVTSSIQTQLDSKFILPSLTSGSVLFSNGTTIAQDNANLFWDDTNNRLGIGTATPSQPLEVIGTIRSTTLTATSSVSTGTVNANVLATNGGNLSLLGSGTAGLVMYQSTRNVIIQNGGTFTDAGYRLDVNGTARVSGALTVSAGIVPSTGGSGSLGTGSFPFVNGVFSGIVYSNTFQGYNSNINFNNTSFTTIARFWNATGNLTLQNGGTFTDAGYKLDVNGTARIQNQLTTTGSISAASAVARGTYLNQTLVATANNDVLVGLDIQPTFTNGAFTGVTNYLLRAGAGIGLRNDGVVFWGNSLSGNNRGILNWDTNRAIISSGTSSTALDLAVNLTTGLKLFTSRSVMIQNGGTFTEESSSQLTVNSTTRGFLLPRITTTQRDAIASPATGLQIFNTTDGYHEFYDAFWGWMPIANQNEWKQKYGFEIFNDGCSSDGFFGAGAFGTGGGNSGANILGFTYGNITMTTGTTTNSGYRLVSNSWIALGGGKTLFTAGCSFAQLSTTTDRYYINLGFHDVFSTNQVDAVGFVYDLNGLNTGSTASANWQCLTSSNSVRTWTTTSVAVGPYQNFRIEINANATQVLFYINDTLVATHTTNIPSGTSRNAQVGCSMNRALGTTSLQTIILDYIGLKMKLTTPR